MKAKRQCTRMSYHGIVADKQVSLLEVIKRADSMVDKRYED